MFEILKLKKIHKKEIQLKRKQKKMYLQWKEEHFKGIEDNYVKIDSILPVNFGGEKAVKNAISQRALKYEEQQKKSKNDKDIFTKAKSYIYKTLKENTTEDIPEIKTNYPSSLFNDGYVKLSWYIFFRELLEKYPQHIQEQILLKQEKDKLFTPAVEEYLENKYEKQLLYEEELKTLAGHFAMAKRFVTKDFWENPEYYKKVFITKTIIPFLFLGCSLILLALIKTLP